MRTSHIMDHVAHNMALRDKWNSFPVKSDRVFKRQLKHAGVIVSDTIEKTIKGKRMSHMAAISLQRIEQYGLYASPDEPTADGDD